MSEEKNVSIEDIKTIESVIGYTFKNKKLLIQAFTRRSYVNEHWNEESNEVLEFYGDRAIDMTITANLSKVFGKIDGGEYITFNPFLPDYLINEGSLSNLRSALVRKRFLADVTEKLDVLQFIRAGKGDLESSTIDQDSVKEDLLEAICGAIALENEWNFNEYSPIISNLLNFNKNIELLIKGSDHIEVLRNWHFKKFGYPIETAYIEKLRDDYFVAGVIIDTYGESLQYDGYGETSIEAKNNALENAYGALFIERERFKYYPNQITDVFKSSWLEGNLENSINILQEMVQANLLLEVQYTYLQEGNTENGNPLWRCKVLYKFNEKEGGEVLTRLYESKKEAKKNAAYYVVKYVYSFFHLSL